MKNIKYIFAALVAFAALSCNKLESPVENPDADLMTLVLSTGEQTKTHISDVTTNGVTEIHWDEGDAITVFSSGTTLGNNKYSFAMSGKPNGNFAQFTGEISRGSDYIWAVYPQSNASTGSTDGSQIVVSLASSQASVANSFASNLNISVAKSKITKNNDWGAVGDYELNETILVNFKNVCSLLKFTAPAEADQIASVVITADKAIVGDLTINYSGESPKVTDVNGGNSITMNGPFAANTDYYFVLAPVAISDLSVYVNTSDNKQYSATRNYGSNSQLQLKPGQYKSLGTLNFNNMPSFSVDFDIQDDGGFLNGTDVIFTFPSNNITDIQLTITQSGGKASRTINVSDPEIDSNGRFVSSCSNDASWPYLPKGTYTIAGRYKTPAGLVSVSGVELKIDADPKFTVGGYDAYTTWSLFKDGKVDDANTKNGSLIYFTAAQSSITISDNILKNANYNDIISVTFAKSATEVATGKFNASLSSNLVVPAVGAYSTPTYHFDGVDKAFANSTCHVTGIPHTANPPKKELGWTTPSNTDVVVWTDDGVQLWGAGSEPVISSPLLYFPEQTKVALNVKADLYSFAAFWTKNYSQMVVRAKGTPIVTVDGQIDNYNKYSGTGSTTKSKEGSFNDNLSSGTYSVEILNTNRAATSVTVKEYSLKYSK